MELVSIDASFEPLIPRFLSNRKKEVAAAIEQAAKTRDSSTIDCDLSVLGSYLDHIKVVYD